MQHIKLFSGIFFISLIGYSQAIQETIYSEILEKDRKLKILLPRGYSDANKKTYPVIYVLDGDYMFEIVSGNVDYYSYWDDMPDAVVVGINQADYRDDDLIYSSQNSFPIDNGSDFFEFIGKELIPYIEKNYNAASFRAIVGHGKTASFINYYLLREKPIFNAYISISPDFPDGMASYIAKRLDIIEQKLFYYMAVSNNDIPFIIKDANALNSKIRLIKNTNLLYTFKKVSGASHYKMPAYVIPEALDKIFFIFQPINKKEYKKSILKLNTSPVEYLIQKYAKIEEQFGIDKQILISDFKAIESAIKKKEQWGYYEDLAKLARKQYPDTFLRNYYLGVYYEKIGKPKKAMRLYRDAYVLEEIGGITKDYLLERADDIKAELGY